MPAVNESVRALVEAVAGKVRREDVFGAIEVGDRLECQARDSAETAYYRLELDGGKLWVGLYMKDRWLSESIESELMNTGDKMEELLDEELVDQGFDAGPLAVEHFRSDDMEFTFRSAIPGGPEDAGEQVVIESAAQIMLAYEACFGQLGDMSESNDG